MLGKAAEKIAKRNNNTAESNFNYDYGTVLSEAGNHKT
jgi:hypothetical protein